MSAANLDVVEARSMVRDESDLELFRECFARNSERPRSLEQLRWQYLDNPTGRLLVDVAVADEGRRIAAIYATLPATMRCGGTTRIGVQSLDTLTDADFRGRGLFNKLAQQTFGRATADGVALVYGFPNGNSAHGFFKKLGWVNLDPVPFLIKPLRSGYFGGKMPRKYAFAAGLIGDVRVGGFAPPLAPRGSKLVKVAGFDARVTELWQDFARSVRIAVDRDERYLRWRVEQKPGEQYETIALERGLRLDALCIYTVKEKHGGRVGYVMELLHRSGKTSDARVVLRAAVRAMARARADAVLAWSFPHSPNRMAFAASGFLPLPEKLRPIELHFGARAFDEQLTPVVRERTSWYLSYLDSDTV